MSVPARPALFVRDWHVSAALTVEAGLLCGLYAGAALRLGRRWPLRRTLAFLAGVGCVLVALESGVDTWDERLLSAHMLQHMVLLLAAPLLLLTGRPLALALRVLHGRRRRRLARALERARPMTRPWWCLTALAAVVVLTHLPGFYDATLRHPVLHDAEHALYLLAGAGLWWPLVDGDPVLTHRLGGLGRLLYLLAGMLPMAVVGAYLNRHASVVYTPYAESARALGISAVNDQAAAGAIMWVVGNTVMVVVGLWAVMAALSAEERRLRAREAHGRTEGAWRG